MLQPAGRSWGKEAVGRCAWLETAGWGWRGGVPRRDLTEQMETHSRKLGHWGESAESAGPCALHKALSLTLFQEREEAGGEF